MIDADTLDFAKGGGLIPVVVQDAATLQVLTLAYMDRAAFDETMPQRRSDLLLALARRALAQGRDLGRPAARRLHHARLRRRRPGAEGPPRRQCLPPEPHQLFRRRGCARSGPPGPLEATIAVRAAADPAESWTARLLAEGPKRIAQKVGEEGSRPRSPAPPDRTRNWLPRRRI
jgi:phosphoribosyl-ATP pyrophosphohydrolase/phosphoribosyl-AMP cyclohydrolase